MVNLPNGDTDHKKYLTGVLISPHSIQNEKNKALPLVVV